MRLSKRQAVSIVRSTSRINIWEGSVRAGKTVGSIVRWLEEVSAGPDGNLLMVGKTERTLRRNVIDPIADLLGPDEDVFDPKYGDGLVKLEGRRIYIAGANDARAIDKIRGVTLAGAYGDEVSSWPEDFFAMLLSRLSVEDARFFGTTNPDSPNHWLLRRYLGADGLDLARFRFRLEDNPFLPDAYREAIVAEMRAAGSLFYRRYILGEWVAAEGAVYDFDVDRHVIDALEPDEHFVDAIASVDYGTTNPTVYLYVGLTDADRIVVWSENRWDPERTLVRRTDREHADAFLEWSRSFDLWPTKTYVDPSAASFSTTLYRDRVPGVTNASNAVLDGIRVVSSLLGSEVHGDSQAAGSPRLVVHSSAEGLIREMTGYSWDAKAQEKGEDKPMKVDDHGPDALRYAILSSWRWWRDWITFTPEQEGDGLA